MEIIQLYFGDGTFDYTDVFDTETSSSAIGTLKDGAGESYTLHRHKFQHKYADLTMPYTAFFTNCCRVSSLKNSPEQAFSVGIIVRLDKGVFSSPRASIPAIIQMYESKANSVDIKPFIFYSGSDSVTCSYNAGGVELAPLPQIINPEGFASLPTASGNELVVTNDCKLQWDLTGHNPTTQFDKYAVSMVIKVAAKSFVQSLDFIIELVEGTPLTCAPRTPVTFNAYPGETKQALFDVGGAGVVGNVSVSTTGLPTGASVGTSASSTALLPAVWEYRYTVPVNASIGLHSQTILQWNQGALRCCKKISTLSSYSVICLAFYLTQIIHSSHQYFSDNNSSGCDYQCVVLDIKLDNN
jgi:hypothetical protein